MLNIFNIESWLIVYFIPETSIPIFPSFPGSGFLSLTNAIPSGVDLEMELVLKLTLSNGLLLYNKYDDDNYLSE